MRPGNDIVIDPADVHGEALPPSVLLDELLAPAVRAEITADALQRRDAWHEVSRKHLKAAGADLAWIWDFELLAEVFLPELRVIEGLRRLLDGTRVRRLILSGFDAELTAVLRTVLDVEVTTEGGPAAVPRYPSATASPWRVSRLGLLRGRIAKTTGVPAHVRGRVFCIPYWHLGALYESLGKGDELVPIHDPFRLPAVPPRRLLKALVRGGWTGQPGVRARRQSRRALATAIDGARRHFWADPLEAFLDRRALRMIEQRGDATAAVFAAYCAAFREPGVRAAVVPFDSPPDTRTVIAAARECGKPVVLIQHGFASEPNDPDRREADVVGVWSERDADFLGGSARGRIVITGNPGGATPSRRECDPERPVTIVLPEYPSRASLRYGTRTTLHSVALALEAIAIARPDTDVVIRPHPVELDVAAHQRIAETFPGLRVRVDMESPLASLIAIADLCVSGISTAALQAGAAGLAVVHLQMAAERSPWPFDGSTPIAVAHDVQGLADSIREALSAQPAVAACRTALGLRPDALARTLALIRSVATVKLR